MNSVYDVIEVLSAWRGLTMKEVALRAGLSYTTFASMMSRRPAKIAKRTLQSLGTVFGTDWYNLLGSDSELVPEFPPTTRYGMRNINGERVCAMMDEKAVNASESRRTAGSKTGAANLTRALIWCSIISTTTA